MHFITVEDKYYGKEKKVYLNIDAITHICLTLAPPHGGAYDGRYVVYTSGGAIGVSEEDCQRILDEIQKYNGRTTVKALRKE